MGDTKNRPQCNSTRRVVINGPRTEYFLSCVSSSVLPKNFKLSKGFALEVVVLTKVQQLASSLEALCYKTVKGTDLFDVRFFKARERVRWRENEGQMESASAYFVQAGVLNVVRSDGLLSFDLHVDVHPYGARHRRLIRTLVWVESREAEPFISG